MNTRIPEITCRPVCMTMRIWEMLYTRGVMVWQSVITIK